MADKEHFTFTESLSITSSGGPDFYLLTKKQWNMLRDGLEKAMPARELAMWALVGITGGVSLGGLTSYLTVGVAVSGSKAYVYVGILILLLFLCAYFVVSAVKNSAESTAKSVYDQMKILEPGLMAATIGLFEETREDIRRGLAPRGYYNGRSKAGKLLKTIDTYLDPEKEE